MNQIIHTKDRLIHKHEAGSIRLPETGGLKMKEFTAYCGLDCETCEARIATVNNDDVLRKKVAALWSKLNSAEITPEMISCTGCRLPGVKTMYCDSLCPIRQCAKAREMETCGSCPEMKTCEKLNAIIQNNPDAGRRLEEF